MTSEQNASPDSESLLFKADLYHQAGNLKEATDLYRSIIEMDCNHTKAHKKLFDIKKNAGNYERVVTAYNDFLTVPEKKTENKENNLPDNKKITQPKFSVIIPVRNNKLLTLKCLRSVAFTFSFLTKDTEYILINDDSDPKHGIIDLFLKFREQVKGAVKIINSKKHLHYTGSFSYGLSQSTGDNIIFLSNDMMITPEFVKTLLEVSAQDQQIGIVRGTSQYTDSHNEYIIVPPFPVLDYKDILRFSAYIADCYQYTREENNILSGDAILIKKAVVDKIGILDTRFFGYFGDPDYGLRAQRAGFKLVCAKGAWLHHEGAGHIKGQSKEYTQLMSNRRDLVQAAYKQFREKWGEKSLQPEYTDTTHIDFEALKDQKETIIDIYENPAKLDYSHVELL
ncbi:MAG: hypothetical protein A2X42_06230 [Candidatus Margulisbacteria bacterium GWF2_38_17]|nr:MAG: hypothetical protein A2X43_02955 [Candidatus Margulisbacteria bacterium GWD2_39_127]OGI01207.1 MAG: hypothetical protein A2X42_06230 [Candidatus Margulisbacteria bacterium GWF2_38_17]OGI09842.1 MAG: hypothetical protein A2X41_09950 [Candidatus Margulisbacteria bacterium GWE2_39_32]